MALDPAAQPGWPPAPALPCLLFNPHFTLFSCLPTPPLTAEVGRPLFIPHGRLAGGPQA